MSEAVNTIPVALAIHKDIVGDFYDTPLAKNQEITLSDVPDYDIMTLEVNQYMDIIPSIQHYLPFIKVIMPIELDAKIRSNFLNYDKTDLPSSLSM